MQRPHTLEGSGADTVTLRGQPLSIRTADVRVRWLREKIEVDPANPQRIATVHGIGASRDEEVLTLVRTAGRFRLQNLDTLLTTP